MFKIRPSKWGWSQLAVLVALPTLSLSAAFGAPAVTIAPAADGQHVTGTGYEAGIDKGGALSSLKIGGQEFLRAQGNIPRGAYLYQNGVVSLPNVSPVGVEGLTAQGNDASIDYAFSPSAITVTATNKTTNNMIYYIVFEQAVNAFINNGGDAVRPFANVPIGPGGISWFAGNARLKVDGGASIFGPWQDNYEVLQANIPAGEKKQFTLDTGSATPDELAKVARAVALKPPPPPQVPDVAAPKMRADGELNDNFKAQHEAFLQRAQQGPVGLLFLGDSITNRWRSEGNRDIMDKYFGKYQPANFGIEGDQTQHVLWRIANGELDNIKPKVVVMMIGTNNMGYPAPDIVKGDAAIVAAIHRKLPDTKVLVLGIFPRGANATDAVRTKIKGINAELAKLDDGNKTRFLDFGDKFLDANGNITKEMMPDSLHPNTIGYQIWADAISPLVDEMMK